MNLLGSADDVLSLDRIRASLIRLEDTIIFCERMAGLDRLQGQDQRAESVIDLASALIERAQFAWNPKLYQPGGIPELEKAGHYGSWLDWFLKETESMHGRMTSNQIVSPEIISTVTLISLVLPFSQGPPV